MAIWTEEVSNEGHVYAALDDDLTASNIWLACEDGLPGDVFRCCRGIGDGGGAMNKLLTRCPVWQLHRAGCGWLFAKVGGQNRKLTQLPFVV